MANPVDEYVGGSIGPGALGYDAAELAGLPSSVRGNVEAVLEERNDAGAWASLALSSLSLAAETLPADLLSNLRDSLTNAIGDAASAVGNTFDQIGGLPIVGQAIEFLWEYVGGRLVDEASDVADEKIKRSRQAGEYARTAMVFAVMADDPNAMVFAPLVAELLYPYWVSGREYRFRPAFRPVVKAPIMFGYPAAYFSGPCFGENDGAIYRIRGPAWRVPAPAPKAYMPGPTNPNLYWRAFVDRDHNDAVSDPWQKVEGKGCNASTLLSALYYPFIPSQRKITDYGIGARVSSTGTNRQLLIYQTKLLSDPSTNLRVDLKRAQRIAADFSAWWNARAREKGIQIDTRPRAPGDWTKGRDPDYYLKHGVVRAYEPGRSLSTVGVTSPDEASRLITIADRNAVVAQTLALGRARAEMLRNTGAMRTVLASGVKVDAGVRKAVEFSAEQSGLLPRKTVAARKVPKKVARGYVDLGALEPPKAKPHLGAEVESKSSTTGKKVAIGLGVTAALGAAGATVWGVRTGRVKLPKL